MSKVTVKSTIKSLEKALKELKTLPPTLEVQGNFDQGGYTDDSFSLSKLNLNVSHISDEDLDEDYDPEDPERPTPYVCVVAEFIG